VSILSTACELVEATVSRTVLRSMRAELIRRDFNPHAWPAKLLDRIGVDDDGELFTVDVTEKLALKLQAMAAHASRVVEAPSFTGLPPGVFHRLLSVEWFHLSRFVDGRFTELVAVTAGA